jgi:hypothetical protein
VNVAVPDKWTSTYETTQPWVLYHYGLTHDLWWPFWNSTRVLGRAKIILECIVCGEQKRVSIRIPRFGDVPDKGHHPLRNAFLAEHAHPDRGAPMSWAMPLANLDAYPGGINLDALAMRLEADLNERLRDGEESS